MIINGELQTGLGGGICQVSTTVFNAAYEAGLQIDERTNHALYISHYPLGRDATVNYPDLDLKFTNDTDNWLLAAHVRRLRLADGQPLRNASEPAGRVDRAAASSHRRTEGEARSGPDVAEGQERGARIRRAGARDERQPEGVRRRTASCCTRTPGTRSTGPSRGSSAWERSRSRSRRRSRRRSIRSSPAKWTACRTPRRRLRLSLSDHLDEPGGHARRQARGRVDDRMRGVAVGDEDAFTLDRVLVAEARAAQVDAARPDRQPLVEVRRR